MSTLPSDPSADMFRWRARFWPLTSAGHLPAELLLRQLASVTKSNTVMGSSIVHEASDVEVPYAHTHLAWLWERAPNLHGARLMAPRAAANAGLGSSQRCCSCASCWRVDLAPADAAFYTAA